LKDKSTRRGKETDREWCRCDVEEEEEDVVAPVLLVEDVGGIVPPEEDVFQMAFTKVDRGLRDKEDGGGCGGGGGGTPVADATDDDVSPSLLGCSGDGNVGVVQSGEGGNIGAVWTFRSE
jgi:hypothetical protein